VVLCVAGHSAGSTRAAALCHRPDVLCADSRSSDRRRRNGSAADQTARRGKRTANRLALRSPVLEIRAKADVFPALHAIDGYFGIHGFLAAVRRGYRILALWGALLSVGYTSTLLPYTAWGAELSTDYRGRSVVSAFREGATLIGTVVAVVLPFAVGLDDTGGFHGLAAVAVLTIVLLPAAGLLAVKTVPEPVNRSTIRLTFANSLGFVAGNRPFVRLVVAFLLNGFANAIPATLFLYFVSERLGASELRGPLLFLYFLCGIVGVPLAVWVASKAGKHRTWCGAMTVACVFFAFAGLLGSGDIVPFALICGATGVLLGFDLALPPAIQADVIDYDTARSGEQRSGLYFAAWQHPGGY